ncbi:beta-galactosidase trimerization domain-containing protein [Paenibacillus allorhizosphaerae]|nr:beta-galactosidase trimerization domain-containing protein [Paenibacillus allorhizosphaerae]
MNKLKATGLFMIGLLLVSSTAKNVKAVVLDDAQQAGSKKTSIESSHKGTELMIPSLWWRQLSVTEGGQLAYWDTEKLKELGANWVSASYRPLDENNKFVGTSWVIPPGMIERVMELAKPGLESAHNAGIKVVGTSDSMQFRPEVMVSVGINPELLYGRDLAGNPIKIDAYQKGNYMSCLLNPYWQDIETKIGKAHAEAGFDGLFLDLFPYTSGEGVLCGCEYCKKAWEAYSQKVFGMAQPFPSAVLDLNRSVDRTFLTFRIEAIYNFMQHVEQAGKKYNPDFKVMLNCNADNPTMAYLLRLGMPQPISELGQLNAGEESSLYLYRMIESATDDPLFAQFNGPNQYMPDYKYKTELAEAFAGGGGLMLAAKNDDLDAVNKNFTDFLNKNKPTYEGAVSEARVGILYSWRDHTFLQSSAMKRTDRMLWAKNSARRTAAILASKGIPYDYIFVENGLRKKELSDYDVLIAPDLKLLDDKDAEDIRKYVEKGGRLLTLGTFGSLKSAGTDYLTRDSSLLKSWTGKEMENGYFEATLGKGKIGGSATYAIGNSESAMIISDSFNKAAGYVELDSQLKVNHNGNGRVESAIRKNGSARYIHLIRYNNRGDIGQKKASVIYKVPEQYKVKEVTGDSPYSGDMGIQWKEEGGSLTVNIENLDLYGVLKVELEPSAGLNRIFNTRRVR